jgi:hypothetical protein
MRDVISIWTNGKKIMIKTLQIIPPNKLEFIKHLETLNIDKKIVDFIILCTTHNNTQVNLEMDDFYIDYPYKFNLYNYTQKFKGELKLKAVKRGFSIKSKETNFFTFDDILIKDNKYIRPKSKPGYDSYYNYLQSHFSWFKQDNEFVIIDYPECTLLNDMVFSESFLKEFTQLIKDLFYNRIWLNNFNNYSVRWGNNKIILFDIDMFYLMDENPQLKDIDNISDLFKYILKYKLNPKEINYRLKFNDSITKEVVEYIYYTYWFLENMAQYIRKNFDDITES